MAVGSRDQDGNPVVEYVACRPAEGVVKGEIRNIEQASQSIREAIMQAEAALDIRITDAYAGVSGPHIRSAHSSYYVFVGGDGEIREKEVQMLRDNMSNMQAPDGQRILEFMPLNYVIDSEEQVTNPVGMYGKKLEATFNFILGEATATSRIEKAMDKVGVTLTDLFINPLAAAEAVVTPDEKELGVAVLDMGAGTTDICIYFDKTARHIGVVPLGADVINKDIRSFGILERYIERLKVEYGSAQPERADADKLIKVPGRTPRDPKEVSFRNLATIINSRLQDILDYAAAEIRAAGYEGKLGAGLVITGGCAATKDLEAMIREYTGMEVRIAAPDVQVSETCGAGASDPRFATAIGLLLRGMSSARPAHNGNMHTISAGTRLRDAAPTAAPAKQQPARPAPAPAAAPAPVPQPQPEPPMRKQQSAPEPEPTADVVFEQDDRDQSKGRKRNPFSALMDKISRQFDIVDDNEI